MHGTATPPQSRAAELVDMVCAGSAGVVDANGVVAPEAMAARVAALARQLAAAGVGDGVPVGVAIEPSADLVAAVLAVLRAGATVVPLDPSYPRARLAAMSGAAGLRVVLCDARGDAALAGAVDAPRVRVEHAEAGLAAVRAAPVAGLEGCAYLLFTSGSTGVPKGVAMPAQAVAVLIDWQVRTHPLGAGARTLQFAASSFDVFFQELLATWCEGGTLVVPPPDERRDGFRLARRIADAGVARLFLPFVALQQLAVAVAADGMRLPALRQVITAGEQLQATDPVRALFAAHPGARLFNQYGPTETHVVTELALDPDPSTWERLPAIGTPPPHVRVLVEERGNGEPGGELLVGGACVARGYLGQPELTAERFVADGDGERWYRTGDRVQWRPDGALAFLGRLDDQVKVRGFRVELGEVEAVLSSHPDVAASVAFAVESATGGRTLAAAVQPRDGAHVTPDAVRDHAREQVPDHAVPLRVEVVEDLPRTPSGKVDRRALASPPAADEVAPVSGGPVARLVCSVLSEELGSAVSADDALLDVGADSLLAMVVAGRLRDDLGVEVSVDDLLDAVSIAAIARTLEAR